MVIGLLAVLVRVAVIAGGDRGDAGQRLGRSHFIENVGGLV